MREGRVFSAQEIRGVLLPVGRHYLLLPNAAVAEVIAFEEPKTQPGAPDWLLGQLAWRGRTIPVVSWERAVEESEPDWEARRVRIVVLNTLNGNSALPHIGILSVGIARLARIRADVLAEDPTEETASPLVKASVFITGLPAWIPDLDELERWVGSVRGE